MGSLTATINPVKITRTIKIECWDCGLDIHRHTTERTANNCLAIRAKKKSQPTQKQKDKRDYAIARRVVSGESYSSVGRDIGLTGQSVRRVTLKILRWSQPANRDTPCYYHYISEVREHADYWLNRIDLLSRIRAITYPPSE